MCRITSIVDNLPQMFVFVVVLSLSTSFWENGFFNALYFLYLPNAGNTSKRRPDMAIKIPAT